jgi:hypothetical protein
MHETRNVWHTSATWRSLMQRFLRPVIECSTGTGHLISPEALEKPLHRCFKRVRVALVVPDKDGETALMRSESWTPYDFSACLSFFTFLSLSRSLFSA